jgi:dolichol-phosphate mannosyltransferase
MNESQWQVPAFETHELAPRASDVCVAIFVLNENGRLVRQLEKMRAREPRLDIIVADGGSDDGSTEPERLRGLGVRTLLIKRGPGKLGAQMRMAFAYALRQGYRGVITVDGNDKDGVNEALPRFAARLDEGYDHVQGSRYIPGGRHENTPFLRHWGVRLLHSPLISLASGFRYTDTTNGFRAYSRRFLEDPRTALFRDELSGYELHYYLAIRAAKLGFRVGEVPVTRIYPATGKTPTKITGWRGNTKVLGTLVRTCLGAYDPR